MSDLDPQVKDFHFHVDDKPLKSLTEALSHVLHDIDPVGTCCTVNLDMEHWYDYEAFHTALLLNSGVPLKAAILRAHDLWYWDDLLVERWGKKRLGEDRLDALIAQIDEGIRYVSSHRDMLSLHRMLFEYMLPYLEAYITPSWDYAAFMRTAPEQLDPNAKRTDLSDDIPDSFILPHIGEPDRYQYLPPIHYLLYEKTRRRTASEHLLTYDRFRQNVMRQIDSGQASASPFRHICSAIPLPGWDP